MKGEFSSYVINAPYYCYLITLYALQGRGRSASPEQRSYRDNGDNGSNERRTSLTVYQDQDKKVIEELVHRIGRLEQMIRDKDREKDNTESYERKENLERREMTPGRRERKADSHDLEQRMSYLTSDVEELSEQVTSIHIALHGITQYCEATISFSLLLFLLLSTQSRIVTLLFYPATLLLTAIYYLSHQMSGTVINVRDIQRQGVQNMTQIGTVGKPLCCIVSDVYSLIFFMSG